jgi:L-ribulose-5-phosphate 3-epimerase
MKRLNVSGLISGGQGQAGACTRRAFIRKASTAALAACAGSSLPGLAAGLSACPIVVFSKIYQELKLNFESSAALTSEAGLDGIDCPVRPGGEILPERAAEDLPRYAEVLGRKQLKLHLLTSGITGVASPHAEAILRAAKKQGVRYYRLGFFEAKKDWPSGKQAKEVRSALKDVASMNREIGVCALFQNHSGSFGANLTDLRDVVSEFDPAQLGVAFDIGHAILIHGEGWKSHFEAIAPHLRVAYIKDARQGTNWVRFGEGDIARTGYFKRLQELGYSAPFSLHIEFDWSNGGKSRNRESLLRALRQSRTVLKQWIDEV